MNKMRRYRQLSLTRQLFTAIILFGLSCCPIWGLIPDKAIDQYLVDKWGIEDGIPSNSIRSITQTPDGYLWIATSKGLVRCDGEKFLVNPFPGKNELYSREIRILFLDREKTLWIGSSKGLSSYRFGSDSLTIFTGTDGVIDDGIRCIKEDMKGDLWISFDSSYVNRLSNGEFSAFNTSHGLKSNRINTIAEDRQGNLLFGTSDSGIFIYKDGKFHEHLISVLENFRINMLYEDQKGDLWIATNNGLFRVTTVRTERYTVKDGLSHNYIISILEDSDRNLWAGTAKGLNRIKRKQDGAVGFEYSLKSFTIYCLFEDREKNLWIGTDKSGLKRLKNGKFISYAPFKEYQDAEPVSVFEDRHGYTWVGTSGGKLFRCRGSKIIESLDIPKLSGTGITAITEDTEGNLWIGTIDKGVFQKKNGTFTQLTTREGLADNLVTSIYRDCRGNLWFSTFDGVSVCYRDGAVKSFKSGDGLSGKIVHNVYEDKNKNIWIATDKGITVLKDGRMSKQHATFYLPGTSVTCIYEDPSVPDEEDGVYWIATDADGLKRLDLKNGSTTSYKTTQGMTSDSIYQFLEDQQGNFWLMSDSGILRVKKSELNRFARGEQNKINCISYGLSDGMKSLEFDNKLSRHSALKTGNGEFWFVTKKGISIVNPGKIRINKTPPPVVIEAVFFNRQSVPLGSKPGTYTFKGITDFSCYFIAPTFLSPEKIKFKYRLEGLEKEWVYLPAGKERIAEYQDLDPGTYRFTVIACNAEGVWNKDGDSITFTLEPFFHQTLVFKIAVFLLFLALLAAAVYVYRERPFDRKKKSKDSPLHPHFSGACIKKLEHLMQGEKVYRDETISLQSLAERLSIKPHQLSQIVNEKLDRNFTDFINYHRIDEAKNILASPEGAERKKTSIAFDVGFNSMTAFYKAFKKYTGMTPSEYKKEVEK